MDIDPQSLDWHDALAGYRYPVDLRKFSDRSSFEGWFDQNLVAGDLSETTRFENRFRESAGSHLEPWYEVVFWKMYSQGNARDSQTKRTMKLFRDNNTSAQRLWERCSEFTQSESEGSFRQFQDLLIKGDSIAVAFTFVAFSTPSRFPMVDTRTARYVASDPSRLDFPSARNIDKTLNKFRTSRRSTYLTLSDWDFISGWVDWCRKMADRLSAHKKHIWRARDVEMAVFRAWGEPRERRSIPKNIPRYQLIDRLSQRSDLI